MTSRQSALLISDACVLIDYCKAECHDIIELISSNILPIKVPLVVLREVDQLTNDEAEDLGISLLELSMDQMREATVRGGMSQPDRLCFIAARDNNGAVWSNDKRLRKMCRENNVQVFWGLEMLLVLVRGEYLRKIEARKAAVRIHEVDPHYITARLLNRFLRRLKDL